MIAETLKKPEHRSVSMRLAGLLIFLIYGCSAKQGYLVLQEWQRQQCSGVVDRLERDQCYTDAKRTYEEYINSEEYKKSTQKGGG